MVDRHPPAMELLGDLERAFATGLYPLRVPIAIVFVAGFALLLRTARRRRWLDLARRHPARSLTAIVVALAIGLPAAWYLGSPLFIRTALSEPAPSVAATTMPAPEPSPAASAGTDTRPSNPPSVAPPAEPTPTPTPVLAAERRGTFHGADDFHFGEGTARLIETAPGVFTVRVEEFSVRNGPDLYVYVSPKANGWSRTAIELGPLKATDGAFNMPVPAGADVREARSIIVWCKQFGVLFAVAELD
jgi:hypothetical protein